MNLGSESPISLNDMIATVSEACGVTPEICQEPMQPGDVNHTFADIRKARRLLDYNPVMPFGEGVRLQMQWMHIQL